MTHELSQPQAAPRALTPAGTMLGMIALFLALFLVMLLPAIWNGFPFVMEDSIGYSGQGVGWMRSKTAAVAVAPLYRLVGYWGLPLVNAALTAGAWLALCRTFRLPGWPSILAIPLSILALQPVYASAVLVDIWFFGAIVLAIVAMIQASPFLALLAGIVLTSHGSGVLLFAALAVGAALVFRNARFLLMAGVTLATAFAVNLALDLRHHPDMPRLQNTFVASRFFSVYPELLTRECQRSGETLLCDHAALVDGLRHEPQNAGRRDFFWEMAFRTDPPIDLVKFEREHALPVITDAIGYKPWELAGSIAADFASFYLPDTKFDFPATVHEPMPAPFARSRQAAGVMERATTRTVATASRYLLYGVVIAAIAFGWRRMSVDERRWVFLLLALCLANDILFATLSGPPDRYHHRILGLAAAAALIAVGSGARRRQDSAGR